MRSLRRQPRFVKGVYTDGGAHTITLWPKNPAQILLYVSSYPLRPGPTCGQVRGPQAGRDRSMGSSRSSGCRWTTPGGQGDRRAAHHLPR
jgi:hypothetical protein